MSERPKIKGSVSKRGEKFLAQLPPSQGRRGKTFDDEGDAWAWLALEGSKVTLNIPDPEPAPITAGRVGELVLTWLRHRERSGSVKESTLRKEYYLTARHIIDAPLGRLPIEAVLGMHVDDCLMTTPANWTRVEVASVMSAFFGWAENNQLTKRGNPYRQSSGKDMCKAVRRTNPPKVSTETAWTPEQLITFIAAEKDRVLRDFWIFVAATGSRRGEAVGLRWSRTDTAAGWCDLKDNVTTQGSEIVYISSPKNWKPRRIYFGKAVGEVLAARRAEQDSHKAGYGSLWSDDYVFDRRRGYGSRFYPGIHMDPTNLTRRFNTRVERLKLPALGGPHGLRRTFATIAERRGHHRSVREAALGHTPDLPGLYTKVSEDELRALAEDMSNLILPNG